MITDIIPNSSVTITENGLTIFIKTRLQIDIFNLYYKIPNRPEIRPIPLEDTLSRRTSLGYIVYQDKKIRETTPKESPIICNTIVISTNESRSGKIPTIYEVISCATISPKKK